MKDYRKSFPVRPTSAKAGRPYKKTRIIKTNLS